MKIEAPLPIARLAADLACAGDRSLHDAAHATGVDPMIVVASLRRLAK